MPEDIQKKDLRKEYGSVGTRIYGGIIDVDYQENWKDLSKRIETIDEMVGSDATVQQVYEAKTGPILSAYYYLNPADTSTQAEKIKNLIHENLFEHLDFQQLLTEIVTCVKYGFSIHAINYDIKDGIIFVRPKFLEQASIYRWKTTKGEWTNGHPSGITQQIFGNDEEKNSSFPEIPWDRILLCSYKRTGNNFEGVSMFRSAYIHWYFKNLMYKIGAIYGERFGAGIPTFEYKKGTSKEAIAKFEELLKNVHSNEQAHMLYEEGNVFTIATPSGGSIQTFIGDFIEHHNKQIYASCNAGFLNLAGGEGGSYALSKDQRSFFMETLEADGDFYVERLQRLINHVTILNGYPKELAPQLCISDIGSMSLDEYTNAMATSKTNGLITYQRSDEEKMRSQLKLDPLPEDIIPEYEMPNKEEQEIGEEKEKKMEEEDTEEKEPNGLKKKLARIQVSQREKTFIKNISDFDNYLEGEYSRVLGIVEKIEEQMQARTLQFYTDLEKKDPSGNKKGVERKDGVEVIASNPYVRKKMNETIRDIKAMENTLTKKLIKSPLQDRIFRITQEMALKAIKEDEQTFATITVDQGKFNSFIAGYISNIDGVIYNDPRRAKEWITQNVGSQVSIELAKEQAKTPIFNRNTLKLSVTAHPRGAYNAIQYDANVKRGFTFFKALIPKSRLKTLSPGGETASILYTISTASEINGTASEKTGGKNTSAINGLGIHHGSYVFWLAVATAVLMQEQEIATEQRRELQEYLDRQNEEE